MCHPNESEAGVAQAVEQRIRNAWVGGSNPSTGIPDCWFDLIQGSAIVEHARILLDQDIEDHTGQTYRFATLRPTLAAPATAYAPLEQPEH